MFFKMFFKKKFNLEKIYLRRIDKYWANISGGYYDSEILYVAIIQDVPFLSRFKLIQNL